MQLPKLMVPAISFLAATDALPSKPEANGTSKLVARQRPVKPCSHLTGGVHVIAASGDGADNIGQYGLLGSLATSILNAIPGSTNVTLPYPKGSSDTVGKTTAGVCPTQGDDGRR